MNIVSRILQTKGSDIFSIEPDRSVFDAVTIMADKGIGAVLVIENTEILGIITERCYAREVILKGKSSRDTAVREIMMTDTPRVTPESTVQECMALMTDKFIRHLPVMDQDRLVGLVSIGDLVKAIIDEQQSTIKDLQRYIAG